MAETKQERKTFKYGDQEYLVDDLAKLHSEQRQYFHNFARDKMFYDENAIKMLDDAMTNRFKAAEEGRTFSASGALDDDAANNITLQLSRRDKRKYGKEFGKDTNPDTDITAAAAHYISKLVGQLKPYQRETDKGNWDVSKHGFEAYLKGQGVNAKDVFERYDLKDENNPDAARSYAQRDEQLRKHLAGYKAWLEGKSFDFTKNDNEWDDDYMTTLNNLVNNADWSDRTALAASLRKLGSGDGYATAFTSDRWDLSKTDEQLSAEAKARKEEEEAKQKQAYMDEFEEASYKSKRASNPVYHTGYDGEDGFSIDWYGDLNASQRSEYGTYLGRDNNAWKKAWDSYIASTKGGSAYTDKNLGILLQGTFATQPHAFIDLGDGKYLIRDSVTDMGQGIVYDPNSGYTNTVYLGDIANRNEEILNIFRQLAYNYINNKYGTKYEDRPDVLKEGGNLIPKHQYGNEVAYNWDSSNKKSVKERAKENNLTPEVQKARDRYIDSDNKSVDNPDAGFSGAEIARLGSIAMDITSMFLDPITGTAVGLGSTLTNFGADIADDGFQWGDVKNLAINAGFDLLGAIPIFGDAVGTGTKIIRQLTKWGPRVMAGLAAYQGVANFGGMMDSWQKMLSNDEDAKMTVQDWRNIAQSISLVTGGTRAIRNKVAQNKMKNTAKVDGVVAVNVKDKQGNVQQVLVDGDTAKNIRAAQGDKAKVEAELSKLEDFKDKFGENGTLEVVTGRGGWQLPWKKVTDANGHTSRELQSIFSDGRPQVNDYYDFSRIRTKYGTMSEGLYNRNRASVVNDQRGKMSNESFEAEQTKLLDEKGIKAQVDKVKEAVAARRKHLEDIKNEVTTIEGKIDPLRQKAGGDDFVARQADAETRLAGMSSKQAVNDAQAIIASRQKAIERAKTQRQDLADSRQKQLTDMETGMNNRLDVMSKTLNRMKSRLKTLQSKEAAGTIGKKEATELRNLPTRIKNQQKAIKDTKQQIINNTARIKSIYGQKRNKLKSDIKTATGEIATATPIAAQSKDMQAAIAQREAAISGRALQERLNTIQGRRSALDPATAHTRAYRDLETMLNNLRTSNPTIGSRSVNWDMDAILQKYGVKSSDVFKQGGSINRNKINKFLNYAKR